jgi:hypothetical protein
MPRLILTLLLLAAPGLAAAQGLTRCERIQASTRPDIAPTSRYEVGIEGGHVRRIVLTLTNGRRSITDLMPMRGGVSVRLIAFPSPQDPKQVTAVFNRAQLGPGGEVLVETWIRPPSTDEPVYNFYRIRCPTGGGSDKPRP